MMWPIGEKALNFRRRTYSDDATGRAVVNTTSTGTLNGSAVPAPQGQRTEFEFDGKRPGADWLLYTRLSEPELMPAGGQGVFAGDEVEIAGRWCLVVRRTTFGDQLGGGQILRHQKYELLEVYP